MLFLFLFCYYFYKKIIFNYKILILHEFSSSLGMWDVWLIVTSLIPWKLELVLLTSMCLINCIDHVIYFFLLVIITCTVHILIMFQLVQYLYSKVTVTIPPCCYPLCVVHGTCTHNNSSLLLPTTCNPRYFIHGMSPTEHTHDILTLLSPTA